MKSRQSDNAGLWSGSTWTRPLPRLLLILALALIYASAFPWLYHHFGMLGRSFSLSYIFLAAWFWGVRGGVAASVLSIPFGMVLSKTTGVEFSGWPMAPILAVVVGAFAGLMKDLSSLFKRQLEKKKRDQKELEAYRSRLEEMAEKRTSELTETNDQLQNEINERRRAEEALRKSEERYRLVVDNAINPIVYLNLDGNILLINEFAARHLGRKPDDFIGKSAYEIFPGLAPLIMERLPKVRETGKGSKFEDLVETPSGKLWFLTNEVPVRDEKGKIVALQLIASDITEQKRAEEALRESEEKYRVLTENVGASVVYFDTDLNVVLANNRACRDFGKDLQTFKGMSIYDLFPKNLAETYAKRFSKIARQGKGAEFEDLLELSGKKRWMSSRIEIVRNIKKEHIGYVDIAYDITERKRTQEIMIQTEKMMTVGGLAAGTAHEINNPLAGIMQNIQVMRSRMIDEHPKNIQTAEKCGTTMEAVKAYMEERGILSMFDSIMESGKRASKIVNNMLSFSRKGDTGLEQHNLGKLLDKTVELASSDYDLKKKYDFRRIEIVREYDADMPGVSCEGSKIQQVILNILKNGAEAMSEDGKAETVKRGIGDTEIKAQGTDAGSLQSEVSEQKRLRFILRVMPEVNMARIEIEDNGPGMDEKTRKRVFEPFFTTKPVGVGTGLGLSVAYFIVTENHDGTMEVESSPGKGTKFIIRLPLEK